MILFWKIFALIIVFITTLIKEIFDEKLKNKKGLKIFLVILMALSLIASLIIIVVDDNNSENIAENYKTLQIENDSLSDKIDSLNYIINHGLKKNDENSIILQSQVDELDKKLEPFVKIAIQKYPDISIQDALSRLSKDVKETKELLKPPTLTLYFKKVTKIDNGYNLEVQFVPSKDVPLGLLEFYFEIDTKNSKITNIWPSRYGGAFMAYNDTKTISNDGSNAKLKYSLAGVGIPAFDISVTNPTKIMIKNKYLKEPIILEIK